MTTVTFTVYGPTLPSLTASANEQLEGLLIGAEITVEDLDIDLEVEPYSVATTGEVYIWQGHVTVGVDPPLSN